MVVNAMCPMPDAPVTKPATALGAAARRPFTGVAYISWTETVGAGEPDESLDPAQRSLFGGAGLGSGTPCCATRDSMVSKVA